MVRVLRWPPVLAPSLILRIALHVVPVLWGFGFAVPAYGQKYSFSNYRLTNHGTARHLGLSGATLALPQSDMSALENPAAVSFQESTVQGALGVENSKTNTPNLKAATDKHRSNFTLSVAARPFGFFGASAAYDTDTQLNSRKLTGRTSSGTRLTQTQIPVSLSLRTVEQASVGISYIYHSNLVERLSGGSSAATQSVASQKYSGAAWKLSLLYALSDNFSVGVANQSQALLNQTAQSGGTLASVKQSYVPAKGQLGLAYLLASQGEPAFFTPLENIFSLQLDVVYVPFLDSEQLLLSPMGLTLEATSKIQSFTADKLRTDDTLSFDRRPKWIPKLGVETTWLRTRDLSATTWTGVYFEPKLLQAGDEDMTHLTMGLELTAWFLVAQMAFDFGKGSPAQVYGLGVAMH